MEEVGDGQEGLVVEEGWEVVVGAAGSLWSEQQSWEVARTTQDQVVGAEAAAYWADVEVEVVVQAASARPSTQRKSCTRVEVEVVGAGWEEEQVGQLERQKRQKKRRVREEEVVEEVEMQCWVQVVHLQPVEAQEQCRCWLRRHWLVVHRHPSHLRSLVQLLLLLLCLPYLLTA